MTRPLRLAIFALRTAGIFLAVYVGIWALGGPPMSDAHAYWARDLNALYVGSQVGGPDAYLYSPAFAQAFAPLSALPWPVFAAVWMTILVVVLLWLVGPWALVVLFLPPVVLELRTGNIHLLLALVAVAGLRWSGLWAFVLLTKVTPGIGLLWFAVRREWRSLWIALGMTCVIVVVSLALAPGLWADWIVALATDTGAGSFPNAYPVPLSIRLPLAALIVFWGARSGRAWTVPIAVLLSVPVLWTNAAVILLATLPTLRRPGLLTIRIR